jgi:hypothetical protein
MRRRYPRMGRENERGRLLKAWRGESDGAAARPGATIVDSAPRLTEVDEGALTH